MKVNDLKKYLFISNSSKPTIDELMSRNKVNLDSISIPCIEAVIPMEYEVYMGINLFHAEDLTCDYNIKFYYSSIYRSLFDLRSNYIAYKNLMKILKKENIDVIHCNSPIGGVIGRICGKKTKVSKIIYTAHGFHFYKGAPLINNTLFKLAEIWMAHYTDVIITINKEDYQAAQKFKLRNNGKVYYVPGVGVDIAAIDEAESIRDEVLNLIGGESDSFLIISVGDLNKNKNNEVIIKALKKLQNPKIHYILCGTGEKKDYLISLARKYNLEKTIHFLGFRTDVPQLLKSSDIFAMPSYREGLSRSIIEAMAAGLPCIVSDIRGNVDLIDNGEGGFLVAPDDVDKYAEMISILYENKPLRIKMSNYNLKSVKKYDVNNIKIFIKNIFSGEL